MQITKEQLIKIMPLSKANTDKFLPYLNKYMDAFGINTPLRIAHFLGQIAVESGQLTVWVENLNYSEQGLLKTFPKYFSKTLAKTYARKPQKIASRVYANRLGNGSEQSGDGWKYRGRGIIQITGKSNYKAYGDYLVKTGMNVDLLKNPELLETLPGLIKSGCWWWWAHGCNELADKDSVILLTRKINGGTNGLTERTKFTNTAKKVLV